MDGGYQVLNNDDGVVYSQLIVMNKDYHIEYWDNGQKKWEGTYKDGNLISSKLWNEDGRVK